MIYIICIIYFEVTEAVNYAYVVILELTNFKNNTEKTF